MCDGDRLRDLGRVRGHAFLECADCGFVFTPEASTHGAWCRYASGDRGNITGPAPEDGWSPDLRGPA